MAGHFQTARGRFVVVNSYFPKGSGPDRDNSRVGYKLDFSRTVFARAQALRRRGPVLVIGDYNNAADLLFQIVSRRYEHRPLLMTTNLAFKHWDTIFPNASCAVALIDRLTHHAEIVVIEGDSYRKREAELSQKQRRTKPKRR